MTKLSFTHHPRWKPNKTVFKVTNMTAIMKKLKSMYLNKRVEYIKEGERLGWRGTIENIHSSRFTVLYDNGIKQNYRLNALHYTPKSYLAPKPYLVLI